MSPQVSGRVLARITGSDRICQHFAAPSSLPKSDTDSVRDGRAWYTRRVRLRSVHFRLTYQVTGYHLHPDAPLTVRLGGQRNISAVFERGAADPEAPGQEKGLIRGQAEFDPPPRSVSALQNLLKAPAKPDAAADPGRAAPRRSPRFDELPAPLQVFGRQIYNELSDAAVRTFGVIRWRCALVGPVRPYVSLGMEWSEDGTVWHSFPRDITLRVGAATVQRKLRSGDAAELESMISAGAQEPLAHILLREARAAATVTASYSSALIMAMAALEIGAKHLIGKLVPQAEWLAVEAPTPPIVRVLTDYLPTLPARLVLKGKPVIPPQGLIDTLRKATTARNTAIHAGSRELPLDFVNRVVAAVSDMLCIFDFYAGSAWALDHLTGETRKALAANTGTEAGS